MSKRTRNERLHVFYFIHDLAPFGAQHTILHTVRRRDKERLRVTVCSFWGEESLAAELASHDVEVVCLRAKRFFDPLAWLKLLFLLLREYPRVIVTTLPELGVPARVASLLLPRMAVVQVFQNPLSSEPPFWAYLNKMTLWLCDAVVFTSRGNVDGVVAQRPGIKDRTIVIQNSVTLADVPAGDGAALRRELGLTDGENLIGCVGRLTPQKGHDVLIAAAAELRKENVPVVLLFAGDGELQPELKAHARDKGIEKHVLFLGRRTDVARILASLDIYAAPSRWESFNIALGEAMASRRACVGTSIPGHADILEDKVTGLAVPADDPQALKDAIAWLLGHPKEGQRFAAAARERVLTHFTPEIMAMKYNKLFFSLAE
ncbi:MAG: glycosyltransferase [Elusimicrobiota bacterium]